MMIDAIEGATQETEAAELARLRVEVVALRAEVAAWQRSSDQHANWLVFARGRWPTVEREWIGGALRRRPGV